MLIREKLEEENADKIHMVKGHKEVNMAEDDE